MFAEDFKQLGVYQRAFKAAMRIFEITKGWPKEERYALRAGLEITSLSCSLPRSSVGVYYHAASASYLGRRSVPGCIPTQERGNENKDRARSRRRKSFEGLQAVKRKGAC